MVRLNTKNDRGTVRVAATWKTRILTAAVVGILPILSLGCSQKVKQTASFGKWNAAAERPMVLSSRPVHDTIVNDATDEQLSEADWRVLQSLGPKAIWDRIAEMNKSSRDRKKHGDAATKPTALAKVGASTKPALTAKEIGEQTPTIPLPDGKIRMIYALRNYGGTTISATTDGNTARRNVKVTAPDLAPLVTALATQLGDGSTVAPLPNENTLIITCAPTMKDSVISLLSQLDQPPRQVEITAKMFEVSHDFDFQYGAQLLLNRVAADGTQSALSGFSTKQFANAVAANGTQSGSAEGSILKLMQVFQDAGISVDATFQLMAETGLINVVASPRMTVAAGQTGYMLAGSELPIQSSTVANGVSTNSTSYKPVGVQLYITPQALGPDTVKLHAISVVSAVAGFVPLANMSGDEGPSKLLVNPIIDSREAETTVTLQDGNTLVFGGLRMIRSTSRESKVPGLGDIPGLGWLFKNHRSQKQQTDLYFFVTPTLL
ncbi:MAG: pilus assembly protein CpaC [Phycisphaerales bacterium]|jgi:general secretion pathway protein D|nr:pilus assembly protein CpaC [Phycisphaerales bacterium]